MELTMQGRHANIRELAPRFQKGSKKERSYILDQLTSLAGHTRCYAAFVLRTCGKEHVKILDAARRLCAGSLPGSGSEAQPEATHYTGRATSSASFRGPGACGPPDALSLNSGHDVVHAVGAQND